MTNTGVGGGSSIHLWNAQTGATTLISGANSSAHCNFPRLDQSGRYVAFESDDATLTSNSDGNEHVYIRDTSTGNAQLVDVGANGVTPVSSIMAPFHFSAGGGAVAFDCLDGKLSMNPYKNDAFLRDLNANTTETISVPATGMPSSTPLNPSGVTTSSVSSNGQYVAFVSDCDSIVSIDTNGFPDVYVHDMESGSNTLVSVSASGASSGGGISYSPAISGNGRYVAFASWATNLVATDTNNASDVFVRDLQAGTTVLVSQNVTGTTFGNTNSLAPRISDDGQRVLFFSYATNLTTNPVAGLSAYGGENLYWRDLQAGVTYAITSNGTFQAAAMSADGSNVVFGNLTGSAYLGELQFSLWSAQSHSATVLVTSVSAPIVDVAISADGSRGVFETTGTSGTSGSCYAVDLLAQTNVLLGSFKKTSQTHSQLSADGVFLAYIATNATMSSNQVYLYNFTNGSRTLLSTAYNFPGGANANCDSPAISADGRYVAYRSAASNLVPGDLNNGPDIFLYDSVTGGTTLVSASQLGHRSANGSSRLPFFSGDGQTLFFASEASDLTPGDYNEASDVFALSLTTNGLTTGTLNFSGIFVGPAGGQFSTNEPVTLTWSSPSGVEYQIQFKNNLTDPQWQTLTNPSTVVSGQGSILDLSPNAAQRFYRIVSF
ncbi:MAG TPA: hypothetical protein VH595_20640 [Verrucomicrobiae bacterium]|jgi:hypothetical protein|nr:hypothetical protein [Verrucomicrobiae bacterium]